MSALPPKADIRLNTHCTIPAHLRWWKRKPSL